MFSYSIADFLAYDRTIWLGMVSRYIAHWWWLGLVASLLMLASVRHWRLAGEAATPTFALALLSLCWGWIAWQFHWHEHRSLNWAAGYWTIAFTIQAVLLALAAGLGGAGSRRPRFKQPDAPNQLPPWLVWMSIAGALVLPALTGALVDATPWFGFEWFGLTPDATAIMTLILLALWRQGRGWVRALLLLMPVLSLAVSSLLNQSLAIDATGVSALVALLAMVALWLMPLRHSARKTVASYHRRARGLNQPK